MYALCTAICIIYILRYAKRVKADPIKSVIFEESEKIEQIFGSITHSTLKLNTRMRFMLFVFIMTFVVMVYGVSQLEWWFIEMTATFFVGAIIIGILAKMKEETFVDTFIKGANDLLGVAIIIGIARGITVIMNDGLISDTLLYYASNMTNGMNKGLFINAMFYIYAGLSFFIPSSSGMAVLTMPIMAPLADGVGLGRELIVNAYNYGQGLFAFINPTSLILATLAIVKVGYDKWLKFVMPLVLILLVFIMAMLTILVYI